MEQQVIINNQAKARLQSIIEDELKRELNKTIIARDTLASLTKVLVFFSYVLQIGTTILAFTSSTLNNPMIGMIAGGVGVCTTICMLCKQYCTFQHQIAIQTIQSMSNKVDTMDVLSSRNLQTLDVPISPVYIRDNAISPCNSIAASPLSFPERATTDTYYTFSAPSTSGIRPAQRDSILDATREFLAAQRRGSLRICASEPTVDRDRLGEFSSPERSTTRASQRFLQDVKEKAETPEHPKSRKHSIRSWASSSLKPKLHP